MQLTGDEPFFIVINAGSGRSAAEEKREAIAAVLEAAGRRHDIRVVEEGARLPAQAAEIVAQARRENGVVVACGGDGTLNAVAQQVLGSGRPMGIVPQGTFNYFGRTYGIPADPTEAARILIDARVVPVQAGLVNDRVFLVNASLGLYPELLEDREAYKQRYGRSRLVALWSGLVTLMHHHRQLTLQIDYEGGHRTIRTPTLVVGNNPLQLEQVGIPEGAVLEEGKLVAMAVRPVGTLAMYGLLLRGAMSRLGEADQVTSFGFAGMSVGVGTGRWARRLKVATDGEICIMQTPLRFQVSPDPLPLLVPADREPDGDGG